jgi:hypothetical protein
MHHGWPNHIFSTCHCTILDSMARPSVHCTKCSRCTFTDMLNFLGLRSDHPPLPEGSYACQEALHAISDQTDPLPRDAHEAPSLYHICTHYSLSDVDVSSLIPSFSLLKLTFLILMLGPSVTNFLCNAIIVAISIMSYPLVVGVGGVDRVLRQSWLPSFTNRETRKESTAIPPMKIHINPLPPKTPEPIDIAKIDLHIHRVISLFPDD